VRERRVRREGRGGSLRESAKEYKRVCDKCTSLSLALVLLNFQKRSLFFLFFFLFLNSDLHAADLFPAE